MNLSVIAISAWVDLVILSYRLIPAINGAITNDTIDINLIRIFIAGLEVSLNGSPTVSPE